MNQLSRIRQAFSKLDTTAKRLKSLRTKGDSLLANITFDYSEQELIRRVFKAIFSQFRDADDRSNARSILKKTEWIDG